jgi:hypothetical protein
VDDFASKRLSDYDLRKISKGHRSAGGGTSEDDGKEVSFRNPK